MSRIRLLTTRLVVKPRTASATANRTALVITWNETSVAAGTTSYSSWPSFLNEAISAAVTFTATGAGLAPPFAERSVSTPREAPDPVTSADSFSDPALDLVSEPSPKPFFFFGSSGGGAGSRLGLLVEAG